MPPTLPTRKKPRVKIPTISHVCRRGAGQLLVTVLDGKLLSLDSELGTVNWSLDLGSPLLSSSGIWYENSQDSEPVPHSILPGADGSLYIFSDALGASQALEVGAFAPYFSICKSIAM